ncbi:MAG: Hsp33 family molecular chaperone HslO, partial [Proteobacteria bacterium]|nr:Hsp33 family molecular chaperone HslO [Pseudomonadota bacterium]
MIKKDIFNKDVKEQFRAAAKDRIYRFVVADGMIKGAVIHATRMVGEMQANHELGPLETLILGQGYIAAGLLSSSLKAKNDRISMNIKCSGPVKGLDVESNVFGEVRGYLKTPHIEVENPDRIKYLSTLYGAGFLTMTKYLDNTPHPYSGQVALEYGSIAEDLANY